MKTPTTFSTHHRGVTMIEVIVAIGVMGLIAMGVYYINRNVISIGSYLSTSITEQGELRRTFKEIIPSLRAATQSANGSYAIGQASSTSLIYYSDIDNNGLPERYRFFLSTSTFWRGRIAPTGTPSTYPAASEVITPLIRDVVYSSTTPIFSYYDRSYEGTSSPLAQPVDPLQVRLVKIQITVDKNPSKPPPAHTGVTQVSLRNLKDNL